MRESYTWWLKKLRKADWSLPDKDSMSDWGSNSNKNSLHLCDHHSTSPARCSNANSCSGADGSWCETSVLWAQSSFDWDLYNGNWNGPYSRNSSYAFSVHK